jgi:hypothetical protein
MPLISRSTRRCVSRRALRHVSPWAPMARVTDFDERHPNRPRAATAEGVVRETMRRWTLLILGWLGLWFMRAALEQSMTRHTTVQIPLLIGIGVLAATVGWRRPSTRLGLPTAMLASSVLAVWMVPRLLDAAAEGALIDALKFVTVPMASMLLVQALRGAVPPVRLFVLGNLAFMTAVVGMVLVDSPQRLCVSYGSADQRLAGYLLIGLVASATGWLAFDRRLLRP